jgi:hypothetical protein
MSVECIGVIEFWSHFDEPKHFVTAEFDVWTIVNYDHRAEELMLCFAPRTNIKVLWLVNFHFQKS